MEAVMSGSDIVITGSPEAFYIPAQQISLCASKQLFHIIDAKDNTDNLLCGVLSSKQEWRHEASTQSEPRNLSGQPDGECEACGEGEPARPNNHKKYRSEKRAFFLGKWCGSIKR